VAGLALELGASAARRGGDHRLGVVSSHHGGALDLGIFLAKSRTPFRIFRNRWLDSPCCVQLFESCAIGLLTRARHQTRVSALRTKFWDRVNPRDNSRSLTNSAESSGSDTSWNDAFGWLDVNNFHEMAANHSLVATGDSAGSSTNEPEE